MLNFSKGCIRPLNQAAGHIGMAGQSLAGFVRRNIILALAT
jgi:hypothetical protein